MAKSTWAARQLRNDLQHPANKQPPPTEGLYDVQGVGLVLAVYRHGISWRSEARWAASVSKEARKPK